jgi:hypothetical protein
LRIKDDATTIAVCGNHEGMELELNLFKGIFCSRRKRGEIEITSITEWSECPLIIFAALSAAEYKHVIIGIHYFDHFFTANA